MNEGGVPMEPRVKSVLEKTGIMTFIRIGRKEGPPKKDLSMRIYVTPELYANLRV
ncbi:hypothetical protein F4824DRAFT_502776 [Ustulina deusta]|nr:hypothetical protein F4824DRAFT_502776 [Ustulina deusta]